MTTAETAPLDDRIREWRVGEADVDDLVRTWTRQATLSQPVLWLVVIGVVLMIAGGIGSGDVRLVGFGILVAAIQTLSLALGIRRSSVNLRASYQPGTVVTTAFGYAGFTVTTGRGLVRHDYGAFRRVVERGGWVFLLNRNVRSWAILPRAIFPPEAVARVRQGVATGR